MFRRLEILLILSALAVTLGVSYGAKRATDDAALQEFKMIAERGVQDLSARMSLYLQSLNGAAALINASEDVSAADFENYVETLDIRANLPGINGIGLIVPIQDGMDAAFQRQMSENGTDNFRIHPRIDGPEHFVVKYIFPAGPNDEAAGLNISYEEGRHNTAIQARESGLVRLTPRILLLQDDTRQPGFLLMRPIYGMAEGGAERGAFRGWVYAPFVGANLLSNLSSDQGRNYLLSVFDGLEQTPEARIFDGTTGTEKAGKLETTYPVHLFGRVWTLQFSSTRSFDGVFRSYSSLVLLLGGLLLTAMLAYLLRNMRMRSDALTEVAALRSRQISAREVENRSIMDNAVTAVFILDAADRVISANEAALSCFGYDREEMQGYPFEAFVTAVAEDQGHVRYNATGLTRDGATRVLDIQRNSWKTLDAIARTTVIVRDITAETAAVSAMEETKRRFDLALAGAEIGVFEIDLTTGKSIVSETWCQIMGVADDPATVDSQAVFLSRVHPDDLPLVQAADEACIAGRTARSLSEYRVRFGADEWRWMKSDLVVIQRDEDGRALRLVGTQSDITELQRGRNALITSEAQLRMVLAEAPVGMAMMSDTGEIFGVNEALCALCGRTEEDIRLNCRLRDLVPEEDMKLIYSSVNALMEAGSTEPYQGEHRIKHTNGTERWGLFNISWAYDRNADGNFYIAQINDITDQKELDRMKSEFVSTVSHELRTPLTSIKGALGLLKGSVEKEMAPAGKRLIEIASSNVDRLTTIVNDILDLEKISAGNVAFNFEDINLRELIDAAVRDMSPFAVTHKTTLSVDLPDFDLSIHADRGRMMQILANLISNACKYSWDDSDVMVKAERLDDLAIVYIQNVGPGVPDSFRAQIFKAFSQADSSDTRAKGGTGLGLNIARQIIKRHGGKIGFESIANGPTVFWFTVPVAPSVAREEPASTGPFRHHPGGKLRVLHLEDDLDFAEVVRTGLAPYARITNVTSVTKAREVIGRKHFDIVIMDWRLQDGDSSVLLDEIEKAYPEARLFSLSADGNRKHDGRVLKNMVKSRTDLASIVETITTWLAQAS